MTLRALVLLMNADEKLFVCRAGDSEMLRCTPDEIINEYPLLHDATVELIWRSQLFNGLIIEVTNDNS